MSSITDEEVGGVLVRYAKLDGYAEPKLDEVVGNFVHVESMGDHVWAIVAQTPLCISAVHMAFYVERIPVRWWWDAIKDAWYGRTWPSFHRVGMTITSDERRPAFTTSSEVISGDQE